MKKNIILLILIILIKYSFANEIKVQVNILPQILLGIEYDVNVDIINVEDKSIYLISNAEKGGFWISYVLYEEASGKIIECHTAQAQYLPGYGYIEIKPRGTYRKHLFSIQRCDVKVGQYKLEIYVSSRVDPPKDKGITNYWKGEIKIMSIFEIKQPEGIDKEAYDYFGGCPLCNKDELLQKHPTSTYAGWALLGGKAEIPLPETALPPSFAYFYFPEPVESKMKGSRANWPRITNEYILKLEEYINKRPDSPLRDIMEYKIAYQYAKVMQYEKSKSFLNKLLSESKNRRVLEYSKRFIELIDTGYFQKRIEENKRNLENEYYKKGQK